MIVLVLVRSFPRAADRHRWRAYSGYCARAIRVQFHALNVHGMQRIGVLGQSEADGGNRPAAVDHPELLTAPTIKRARAFGVKLIASLFPSQFPSWPRPTKGSRAIRPGGISRVHRRRRVGEAGDSAPLRPAPPPVPSRCQQTVCVRAQNTNSPAVCAPIFRARAPSSSVRID